MKGVEIVKIKTMPYTTTIYIWLYGLFKMYLKTFLLWFGHFLDPGAEICQIFRCFFGKFKKSKRHSEIIWPLKKSIFIKTGGRQCGYPMHEWCTKDKKSNRRGCIGKYLCILSSRQFWFNNLKLFICTLLLPFIHWAIYGILIAYFPFPFECT